jgi:4-amino-4-deoxy-L-arabinose transferase-like glycosyltransferase
VNALRAARWLLALLAIATVLGGIDNLGRKLAHPDEGRYSEISREMAATGDWVTPRLDGIKYFEKPPLQYWATALAFEAFGANPYSARLYVWLAALATLAVVGFTAFRLSGPEAAAAAVLALMASPYFMALGGIVTLDMGLTLWTTVTACAFLLAEDAVARGRSSRGWMLLAWAALALAVLSKGLVAIIFTGAAVFFHMVLQRDASVLRRMHWGWGVALFLAIAAPWFVLVSRANPEFARFFFVHEHFERFLTHEHRRVEPWWFFLPILALGLVPWVLAYPSAVRAAWRRERGQRLHPLTIALAWAAFVVLFFSASGSKLPAYILPAFPLLAVAIGPYLASAPERALGRRVLPAALVGLARLGAVLGFGPRLVNDPWTRTFVPALRPYAIVGALLLAAGPLAAWMWLRRGQRWHALAVVALANVLAIACLERLYDGLAPRTSGWATVQAMQPYLKPETRLYSVKMYDQTVPFYLGRTVRLVAYVDEFETGQKAEPGASLARLEDFPAEWLRPGEALAIIQPGTFEDLQRQGLPMQVIQQDPRRVLVRKP